MLIEILTFMEIYFKPSKYRRIQAAACLLSAITAHASTNCIVITPAQILRDRLQHIASIRAEANAPGMPRADQLRVTAVVAQRAAKEKHDLAEYERFQFEQRLELAKASAPQIIIYNNGAAPREGAQLDSAGGTGESFGGPVVKQHHGGRFRDMAEAIANAFFARSAIDRSTQEMSADASARVDQANAQDGAVPYAAPVHGKPGLVTSPSSPSSGYIDVRGYAPGSQVVDPYSGQLMRVP